MTSNITTQTESLLLAETKDGVLTTLPLTATFVLNGPI